MIYIRPSLPGDTWLIKADLRQAEIDEFAAIGFTCEECLALGFDDAVTLFIAGEPAGMVGITDDGALWGVFTRAIDRHPIAFLRASKRAIEQLDREAGNIVDARNTKAVAWFRWLGFKVSDPEPLGLNGELFHRFTNARERIAEAA
jgi:hypothetical protein